MACPLCLPTLTRTKIMRYRRRRRSRFRRRRSIFGRRAGIRF